MRSLQNRARRMAGNRGVTSVEYILILVLVALTGVAVFKLFGGTLKNKMNSANQTFQNDVTPQ